MAINNVKVSLIISTYNWPDALELSLYSLSKQVVFPDEIIIADDGSTEETATVIKRMASLFTIPVKHVWHEDLGFRKSLILNKAVKAATGDYIIQIDGDIIVDKKFVKDHLSVMERGCFIRGSRALLMKDSTRKLINRYKAGKLKDISMNGDRNSLNSRRNRFLSWLMTFISSDVLKVKGCNMAYWKDDFVNVNGYNNDFEGWGHEDIELAIRLYNNNVKIKRLKFRGIAYHMWHKFNSRVNDEKNHDLALKILRDKIIEAPNGYKQV